MRKWFFNAAETIDVLIKKPKGYESLSKPVFSCFLSFSRLCEFAVWSRGSVYVLARCVWCEVWHLQVRFSFSWSWRMQVMRGREYSYQEFAKREKHLIYACWILQKCLTSKLENFNSCRSELSLYTSHSSLEQNNTVKKQNKKKFNQIRPQMKQLYLI